MLIIDNPLSFATVITVINVVHVSFAFLFLQEFIVMKMLGYQLFGHENKKIQQMIIHRMTFSAFSILFILSQSWLLKTGNSHEQILTDAFLFSMFLSGGIVSIMLWGLSAMFKKKEEEQPKETIRLYGVSCIKEFEASMTKLSNVLFRLSEIEKDFQQEDIVQINERTKEIQALFVLYKKLSPKAKKEVEEDILHTIDGLTEGLEDLLFSKDEKYVSLIKRKTKRMNTKTV